MASIIKLLLLLVSVWASNALTYSRRTSIQNNRVDSLPALPAPNVETNVKILHATALADVTSEVKSFLGEAVSQNDLEILSSKLFEAVSTKSTRLNFWINTNVGSGVLNLLIVKKEEDRPITLMSGTASITLPKLYVRWTEKLRKRRFLQPTSYSYHERQSERGYTADELKAVSAYLEQALVKHPEIQPHLTD